MQLSRSFLALAALVYVIQGVDASPVKRKAAVSSATLDGFTFLNKGLVGFGYIPSNFRESTGDTLGGFGSAIAVKRGTWTVSADGKHTGTLVARPDRGYNVEETINYQARQHEISFSLTPYYDDKKLSFKDAAKTLQLKYLNTTLQYDRGRKTTSGLNPEAVRPSDDTDPVLPIVAETDSRLSLDVEGLVANKDGSYWIGDEYGPYIYRFSADGNLLQAVQPPDAFLPRDENGNLYFTSAQNPSTGRAENQGMENLTVDEATGTLYAMLQSAAVQDGGGNKATSRYTRLLAYNVSDPDPRVTPSLIGEWVVPLPQKSNGNTLSSSEIHFLGNGVFLALSRDGDGKGGDDTKSKYKNADLFSISKATDIHGSKFDSPKNPIAVSGKLNSSIIPAKYVPFISYIDDKQLSRFGLHNGKDADQGLISAKWESFALLPAADAAYPDDYFLITAADNDFISTDGVALGVPFNAGLDNDNQILVFRVTLPSLPRGSVERAIGF